MESRLSLRWRGLVATATAAFSGACVFPPLGPRALVGATASETVIEATRIWSLICVGAAIGSRVGRFGGSFLDRTVVSSPRWIVALVGLHALMGLAGNNRLVVVVARVGASGVAAVSALEQAEPAAGSRGDAVAGLVGCFLGSATPLVFWVLRRRKRDFSAVLTARRATQSRVLGLGLLVAAVAAVVFQRSRRRRRRRGGQRVLPPVVPLEDGSPPALYASRCGSREAALSRWRRTLAWRCEHDAAGVLREPQPKYHAIKGMYPHSLHGRTVNGELVMWELLGSLDTTVLRNGEVTTDQAFRHFVFVHEFISRKYDGEATRLVTVLDVKGLRFSQVNSFLIRLVSTASAVVDNLVPFRASKILVINAPSWFGAVWGGIRRTLPTEIRDKVEVLDGVTRLAELLQVLPSEYGGEIPLGQHDDELAMLEAACLLNAGEGLDDFFSRQPNTTSSSSSSSRTRTGTRTPPTPLPPPPPACRSSSSPFRSWFGARPTPAHLGTENTRFHYDAQRQQWIFEEEEEDEEDDASLSSDDEEAPSPRRRRHDDADSDSEDERALVAAIEAATLRRSLHSDHAMRAYLHSRDPETCSGLQVGLVAGLAATRFSRAFLAVALAPWLLAPASRGGLGLRVGDAAACCAAASLALLVLASRVSEPCRRMPADAPLRAFRVASGGSFLVAAAAPELAPSLGGGAGTTGELPRDSNAVLVTASVSLALLLLFTHLAAASASAAVKLADLVSDRRVRQTRAAYLATLFGDLSGPPAAAALLAAALDRNAPFPFNASAGLSAFAVLNAALYLLSFLVYKKVVGDVAGSRTNCAAFFELPARDLQRCLDDAMEAGPDDADPR
ncbi:hypothetical protein CTAYLR_003591 [Chrysophaeum taylorii]|uniref:CRAL-TRIO domain-containing protein n=1 Tax=Chrysophaeum taylorii TaxID=2483200 RepID=A0AAD7UL50_9STRA|nr:hypothetical protein CTAYLR_003591 [Chrysophaeum taylorii]